MKHQLVLNEAEKETLMQLCLNHPFKEVRKKAMGLLMFSSGKQIMRIQAELDISHQSIYNWLKGWNSQGIVGLLKVNRQGGRHGLLPDEWVEKAIQLARDAPYSVRQIAYLLEAQFKQPLPCSLRTLTRVLKSGQMTYKRTRMSLKKT